MMMDRQLGNRPKNIRSQNKKLILNLYRRQGLLSVSDLVDQVNLSRTTVMKINEELLSEAVIREAGKGASTDEGGKKPSVYAFNARKNLILTFYIRYGAVHLQLFDLLGETLAEGVTPIPVNESLPRIIEVMVALLKTQRSEEGFDDRLLACVVAVHGNIDSDTGVCLHSTYFPSWGKSFPLRDRLIEALGLSCPLSVENWIRLLAYSEKEKGLAKNHSSVLFVDAGWHGITSGILINGTLYRGRNNLSGEIGHMVLDPRDEVKCACGGRGCFESLTSCLRLLEKATRLASETPDSALALHSGLLTLKVLFQACEDGDPLARSIVGEIVDWFAIGLSNLVLFFDPEIIILEGDYAQAGTWFQEELRCRAAGVSLLRFQRDTPLLFKESSYATVMKGAADLAIEKFYGI
jgi:predicted NBD/HSP70 family sugar kinase